MGNENIDAFPTLKQFFERGNIGSSKDVNVCVLSNFSSLKNGLKSHFSDLELETFDKKKNPLGGKLIAFTATSSEEK